MRLNLIAQNVRSLSLRLSFGPQFAQKIESNIQAQRFPYNDVSKTHHLVGAGYREAGQFYSVSLMARVSGDPPYPLIQMWYTHEEGSPVESAQSLRLNLDKVASFLDGLQIPGFVLCSFQSENVSLNEFEPVLRLPLIVFNGEGSYFQEVCGVRLNRIEGDRVTESINLNKFSGNTLNTHGWAGFNTKSVSSELAFTAFGRVVNLLNQSIIRVRPEGD